ncbi:MAG: beta-lactamase family protein [Acidobacteriota bacterium]|nr:beta-lactamase family protein [Acidobacteriota bacterium]
MKVPLIFFCAACIGLSASPPEKSGVDPGRLAAIPVRMRAFVDAGEVAGTVNLIARHGSIVLLEATGYQDREAKKPMRTDSIFQVMSMTKPLTGTGIMMLMEEGRLSLMDRVEKYLPEFKGQTVGARNASRPITIYDLMTHTSGMASRPRGAMKDLYSKLDRTLAEAVANFATEPLQFEPGSKWMYSSMGIGTLGRIIEVVSGQPYEQFTAERLLRPLGMKDSFFFPPSEKENRIAELYWRGKDGGKLQRVTAALSPYFLGGDPMNFRKGAKYPAPEFGLYSTATDMAAFYQMMLNGGTFHGKRYLSSASVAVMTSIHTGDLKAGFLPGTGYGLTWEVVKDPVGSLTLLSAGTFGHSGIYGTHGWVDVKKDMVGVFLVQIASGTFMDVKNAFFQMAGAAVVD